MSGYRELARRQLLEQLYDKMTDEEKKTFVMLTMENKNREEILDALRSQGTKIDDVSRRIGKYPFASDLLANVSGSAIWDSIVWLGSRILRKL